LHVLDLKTQATRRVAGGLEESIATPLWSRDGRLHYVSDRSNWWNVYQEGKNSPLWAVEGEFALPQWNFGISLIGFSSDGMVGSYVKNGTHAFARTSQDGAWEQFTLPLTSVGSLVADGFQVAMIGASPEMPNAVLLYDLKSRQLTTVKSSRSDRIDPGFLSRPVAVEFPSANGRTAHAFYYPPCNPNFQGMPGEKPPLIVQCHGGPTGHVSPAFTMGHLYWTSRGFAVIDVNYGGSTGYGRSYRNLLKKSWGIVDVDDCTHAALYLVDQGLADGKRLAIAGGSAGGYTTLCALAFRDVFCVGADYFGVTDIERLALDTHKFESRYMDQLVGPYPADRETYIARSPIYSIDKITCPVIIFQGDEDAIVPPAQSEAMYNSLIARKIPTAYLVFKGEQHGFRKAESIQCTLEAQLYFFSKVMGFPLSEKIEPVPFDPK
jgi:dipeptidyl aminopeptidase/acylaminoacyl peptidase